MKYCEICNSELVRRKKEPNDKWEKEGFVRTLVETRGLGIIKLKKIRNGPRSTRRSIIKSIGRRTKRNER